jgi:hypothetical protein
LNWVFWFLKDPASKNSFNLRLLKYIFFLQVSFYTFFNIIVKRIIYQ